MKRDRQRVDFTHQATLRTNLTVKVAVHDQTDATLWRDFFESEYRRNQQPRSFLEVNQAWPNWTLDALAQPQINNKSESQPGSSGTSKLKPNSNKTDSKIRV